MKFRKQQKALTMRSLTSAPSNQNRPDAVLFSGLYKIDMEAKVIDWHIEIETAMSIANEIRKVDKGKILAYHFPNPPATIEQIVNVENHLGFEINVLYKQFLLHANGWKEFGFDIHLFGTEDLGTGENWATLVSEVSALESSSLDASKLDPKEVYPIGHSESTIALWLMGKPRTKLDGQVIWFAGYEIERYVNFEEFFLARVAYNRLLIDELKSGRLKR